MDIVYMNKNEIPEDCSHCNFNVDKLCSASKEWDCDGWTYLCCVKNERHKLCPIRDVEMVRTKTAQDILQQVYDFLNDKNADFDVFELAKKYGVEVEE